MLKPQKKLTKKEIKEDKFVLFAMEAKNYIEENARMVSIVSAVVIALIVVAIGYSYYHSADVEQAATLFGEAQIEYQNLNTLKAKNLLHRLEDEFSGTEEAEKGLFLLANIYYNENKTEEAAKYYQKFINSYSKSPVLLASGMAGYAACMERLGKWSEAAEYYKKAQETAPNFVEAADYLYLAALNYTEAGNLEKAKQALEYIVNNYKESNRVDDAKAHLILLTKK